MGWNRVFYYDFQKDAPDVDRNIWASPQYINEENNPAFYGRTGIRNPHDFKGPIGLIPCTVKNGADLRLSTYNPEAPKHDVIAQAPASTRGLPARVRRMASSAPMARRRAVSIVERMSA